MRVVPDNNTIRRHPVALIRISGEMTALYTADGPAREPALQNGVRSNNNYRNGR